MQSIRTTLVSVAALSLVATFPAVASAGKTTFSFTGGEQTYTVPAGVTALQVTATGARGGGPVGGTTLLAGRGAVVTGTINVTPGQTLYVEVGGIGNDFSQGGFNGGGT